MKIVVAVVVALCVVSASARPSRDDAALFATFKDKYNKVYETPEEEARRFGIFRSTLDRVDRKNREHVHAGGDEVFGVTKFSDMTEAEFAKAYLMKSYTRPSLSLDHYTVLDNGVDGPLPSSFDWREKSGVITPVKNQGQCGSCWAFSTAEEIESMWALAGNPLIKLSPQQIVDCDKGEDGCGGGDTVQAYSYVEQAGGLVPEKDYPYTAENGACRNSIVKKDIAAKIEGFNYATSPQKKNETQMMANLVSTGPISICADAATWQDYSSGIIKHGCGQQLDHCIQITGYGVENGVQYWNVRNSWGTDWGLQGYLKIETQKNLCGIADEATIVTITTPGTGSSGPAPSSSSSSSGSYSSSGSSGYSSSSGSSSGSSSSGGSSGYSSSY